MHIETAQSLYQAHEYLNALKSAGDASFQSAFENYCRQYAIRKETVDAS